MGDIHYMMEREQILPILAVDYYILMDLSLSPYLLISGKADLPSGPKKCLNLEMINLVV